MIKKFIVARNEYHALRVLRRHQEGRYNGDKLFDTWDDAHKFWGTFPLVHKPHYKVYKVGT